MLAGESEHHEDSVMLIPECCYLTGLSIDQQNNFQLVREVTCLTTPAFSQRLIDIKRYFFDNMLSKCKAGEEGSILNEINIGEFPNLTEGFQLPLSSMLMAKLSSGQRQEISLASPASTSQEQINDIEKRMFSQPFIKMFQ